jgi:hypothetical protein
LVEYGSKSNYKGELDGRHGRPSVYGLAQNVLTLKYCSTLEIIFREEIENFILELYFFNSYYTLFLFLFL